MTAHEILTEALEVRYGTTSTWAQHILAALKAAGYAVVELPETRCVNKIRQQLYWEVDAANDAFVTVRPSDQKIANDGVSNPYRSPAQARAHAAALLAAADVAEGSTPTEAA